MSSMSYCRFENAYRDMQVCQAHINDEDLSDSEKRYRDRLVRLCEDITAESDEDGTEDEP